MIPELIPGHDAWKTKESNDRGYTIRKCDICGDEIEGKAYGICGDTYCEDCMEHEFLLKEEW